MFPSSSIKHFLMLDWNGWNISMTNTFTRLSNLWSYFYWDDVKATVYRTKMQDITGHIKLRPMMRLCSGAVKVLLSAELSKLRPSPVSQVVIIPSKVFFFPNWKLKIHQFSVVWNAVLEKVIPHTASRGQICPFERFWPQYVCANEQSLLFKAGIKV